MRTDGKLWIRQTTFFVI